MKPKFSRILAIGGAVALAAFATTAQARVGVSLGINVPIGGPVYAPAPVYPAYVAPQPAYVAPQPAYVAPAPIVYSAPQPVYVAPPPVYVAPPTFGVYLGGGYHRGHHGGHRHWR